MPSLGHRVMLALVGDTSGLIVQQARHRILFTRISQMGLIPKDYYL